MQVEHGCAVAMISGSRGVLVVGGATGDDVVEFLDWEIKNVWRVLGRGNAAADWSTWKQSCLLLADFPHWVTFCDRTTM